MTPAWGDIMMEPLRKVPQATEFVALSQMAPHGDYCFRLTCWSAQLNIYGTRELGRGSGRGLAKRGARLRSSERSLHAGPACRSSPPPSSPRHSDREYPSLPVSLPAFRAVMFPGRAARRPDAGSLSAVGAAWRRLPPRAAPP